MAHTFDTSVANPATLTSTTNTNPIATNYTCGAGATVLVLMISHAGVVARSGGAPTYNSVPMTQADTSRGVTETTVEVWYMVEPPTEVEYSLSIPNSSGLATKVIIASAAAASGYTSEFQDVGYNATTGASPNCTVNTTAGGIVFAVAASGDQGFNPTNQTGVELYNGDIGPWGYSAQYYIETTTSTPRTISFTEATSDDYGMIAVSFKEVYNVQTHEGASALSITSTLTVVGTVKELHQGASALSVTSDQTIVASVTHVINEGAVAINVTSAQTVTDSVTQAIFEGVSAINSTSDLSLTGSTAHKTDSGDSAISVTSTLTIVDSVLHSVLEGASVINITSELTSTNSIVQALLEGAANFNITSAITMAGSVLHTTNSGESTLSVSSSITNVGTVEQATLEAEFSAAITSEMLVTGSSARLGIYAEVAMTTNSFVGTRRWYELVEV